MRKLVLLMVLALASSNVFAQKAPTFRQLTDDEKKVVNTYNFTKNAALVSGLVTGVSVCGSVIYSIEYAENKGYKNGPTNKIARNRFIAATAVSLVSTASFFVANRMIEKKFNDKVIVKVSVGALVLEF